MMRNYEACAVYPRRSVLGGVKIVVLFLLALVFFMPFAWMIMMSFKSAQNIFIMPLSLDLSTFSLENYDYVLNMSRGATGEKMTLNLVDSLKNSFIVTVLSTGGSVLTAALAAYSFAKLRFRGREALFAVLLGTMMVPAQVTLIPMYIVIKQLGWIDTLLPLIVPAALVYPYGVFMLRQYFATVPDAFVEAAKIEGASNIRIWARIMMPLATPTLTTLVLFRFMVSWNDFLVPMIYINSPSKYTITLLMYSFQESYGVAWHYIMAIATISMIPLFLMFIFAQRFFIEGIMLGGVKG